MTRVATHLLIVDPQNDFCDLPPDYCHVEPGAGGRRFAPALPVAGAHADMQRVAGMIERGGAGLDAISVTLDSHQHVDIGHPPFWRRGDGGAVEPFTQVAAADVRAGRYLPRRDEALPRVVEALQDAFERVNCFMPGTMIAVPDGSREVETLKRGDLVLTADGDVKPVVWVGRQTIADSLAEPLRTLPIRIMAGALALGALLCLPYVVGFLRLRADEGLRRPAGLSEKMAFRPGRDLTSHTYLYRYVVGDAQGTEHLFPGALALVLSAAVGCKITRPGSGWSGSPVTGSGISITAFWYSDWSGWRVLD